MSQTWHRCHSPLSDIAPVTFQSPPQMRLQGLLALWQSQSESRCFLVAGLVLCWVAGPYLVNIDVCIVGGARTHMRPNYSFNGLGNRGDTTTLFRVWRTPSSISTGNHHTAKHHRHATRNDTEPQVVSNGKLGFTFPCYPWSTGREPVFKSSGPLQTDRRWRN